MAKVLVVDDDPRVREALQLALQTAGHEVVTAASKDEAKATAVECKPHLMLVDVMMPEGTEGFHLVWEMRQMTDESLKNVPIIMLTGIHQTTELRFYPDQSDGTYKPGEYLPVQGWLDKPTKVDELLKMVGRVLTQ